MKKIILSIFASIILSVTSFSAFAKTEVIWWDLLGGGDGVRMSQMIDAFEKENPDIDIVNSTLEWGPPYYAKLQTSAAIGEQPDIAIYHISRYQMAKGTNIFSPISIDELASVGVTADQYYEPIWNKAKADDDGYLFGLPLDNPLYVMHINLDMFEEAGLLDENGHPTPLDGDFDNFFAAMEKLKAITGDTPPISFINGSQYAIYWWMLSIIYQIGGEIWNPDDGYCPGNECEIAMQFLADLVDKGYNNRNADGATEQGNFVSGKSAIFIDGGWNVPTHVDMARKNELPFKYGVFKVPQLGPKMAAMLHSHTL